MKIIGCFLLLLPALASADVLVRSCASPTASGCSAPIWVLPANATNVQVNRGTTAPYAPLATVLPTERIIACYDDPSVQPGSNTVCAARVPSRSDMWQLKSVLYPAPPALASTITLTVDAANPHWDSGAALATNQLADLYVRLYGATEGQALALVEAVPWASKLTLKRTPQSAERQCFTAALALDTTGDKVPDLESAQTSPWCGTAASPPPVLILQPPNSISGTAP